MDSFDELEELLVYWYGCKAADLAWDDPLPSWLQSDVAEFYRRFGSLTSDTGCFSIKGIPSPLAAQNLIVPVEELRKREDGGVILIHENQGCWTAGQTPESDMLWSSIDLEIGDTPYPGIELFNMEFPIKEALITHALFETVMSAVDAGPAIDPEEWQAAEQDIADSGKVVNRRYITPHGGTAKIGWNVRYMASSWGDEEGFTWIVRRGDRLKGP